MSRYVTASARVSGVGTFARFGLPNAGSIARSRSRAHAGAFVHAAALFMLTLGGCGPDLLYLPALALGQFRVIGDSRPVDEVLAADTLTDEEAAKLRLIVDVREYARTEIGLSVGDSYHTFYDNREGVRMLNVSASRKDRFEPRSWSFPFVGSFPYLGFFDRDAAERYMERLRGEGYDVMMYEVDAYSTLQFFSNPVQATMLARSELSLTDTVIHELLHNTIWRRDDVTFNESLATFFGREGAIAYLRDRYPDEPERVEDAVSQFADIDRYNAFMFDLYAELDEYYSGDLNSEAKIAGREEVFEAGRQRFTDEVQPLMNDPDRYAWVADMPTNNAWMLANYRYNLDLDLFAQVFAATGNGWRNSIAVFREAARAQDTKTYLRQWLEDSTAVTAE